MFEASDLQLVFGEAINGLKEQIDDLEAQLEIPVAGAESSQACFDGMWERNDKFSAPVYIGMARFLIEILEATNTQKPGQLTKFFLNVIGLANQCIATARVIADPGLLNIKLLSDFADIRRAEISRNGKKGTEKRHAPMRELRAWAVDQYRAKKWPSANNAAHELRDLIIEHGRTINAILKKENAQRTIAEWFRKSV